MSRSQTLSDGLIRGGLFASIWWILAGGALDSWPIGVPAVLAATAISLALLPASTWSVRALLAFVPVFLWQSVRGGIEVARIAMHPRLPVAPALIDYRLRLPAGLPRIFMVNAVNLLPGTLSADLRDDRLCVHALDAGADIAAELERLEDRLLAIFGVRRSGPPAQPAGRDDPRGEFDEPAG